MDLSRIQRNLPVNAKNPGVTQGPSVINIGRVERVEPNGYIKLAQNDALTSGDHWFPMDWVESVSNGVVCLNQPADKAISELLK